MGFFTGVQIRPIIVGVVVDYIATYAGTYAYFFIYLAKELSKQGEVTEEAVRNYMTSPEAHDRLHHRRPAIVWEVSLLRTRRENWKLNTGCWWDSAR